MPNEIEYRRHMPHFQSFCRTYLVSFVTRNRRELPPSARDVVLAEVVAQHRVTAFLHTTVVMPEHVHAVLQPHDDFRGFPLLLSEIFRRVKGRSSRQINMLLGRSGQLWQSENHDYEIRNEESIREKCEYVAQNPVRRGLVASPDEYPWLWRWWIDEKAPG